MTLLWDADGTVVYSQPWWEDSFLFTSQHFGLHVPQGRDLKKVFGGMTLRQMYERVVPESLDIEECLRFHVEYQSKTTHLITLFDGEYEILTDFDNLGVKQAIVTSRTSRKLLSENLEDLGILKFFKFIICMEDVTSPKPHPQGIQLAMQRLKSEKKSTFMIGDTKYDIEAGQRAGVSTIGVLFGYEKDDEEFLALGADYYVDKFPQIPKIVLS